MRFVSVVLAACIQVSLALRASNFDFSRELAARYACGDACYNTIHQMNAIDTAHLGIDFDFDFYATASNFSTSVPGDLLKLDTINPNTLATSLPKAVTYYRFQYTSVDGDNRKVPVTGFIAIPHGFQPPSGQYRAVAFAHGTIGVWHGCAVTAELALYDDVTWSPLVKEGYAVVATDYAGLGNNYTDHKYLTLSEHANDVFYAMIAARQAFGSILTHEWMSWGHSQGGGAVWSLAESDLLRSPDAVKAGKFLGTVSVAPVTKLYDSAIFWANLVSKNERLLHDWEILPWLQIAVQRLIPSSTMKILSEVMSKRLELMDVIQACYKPNQYLADDLSISEMFETLDFTLATDLQLFQNMTAPGRGGRANEPILVIQGTTDDTIPTQVTTSAFEDSCAHGNSVHLRTHENKDHFTVLNTAVVLYLHWMDAAFNQAGKWKPRGCTEKHFKAADVTKMNIMKEVSELIGDNTMSAPQPGLLTQPALEL